MSENAPTRHGVDPPDSAAPGGDSATDEAADGEGRSPEELAPAEGRSSDEPAPAEDPSPAELARAERLEGLRETLRVEDGETLERAYLFEPLEREDVAFRLALVVKRIAPDRLEMVAIGARSVGTEAPVSDFVRRARFPDPVLPSILEEFIDRCDVEGSVYREISLVEARSEDGEAIDPFTAFADALYPS